MATRQSQIVINVDDKSLQQLNNEIVELQSSIDGLTVGTEEWIRANEKIGDLKRQFQTATDGATKLQGQIEKISGPQQIQAFAKLGAGMVGAFTVATQSLKAFGIESEAFDEMTAKATSLMAVMGGLNAVAETFSTENIKGLKAIGKGFGNMAQSVKNASRTMRVALIGTGIGAIAIAVTAIVANWDKIKEAIGGVDRAERKAFEASQKRGKQIVQNLQEQNVALEDQLRLMDKRNEYINREADVNVIQENINNQNESLRVQSILVQESIDQKIKDEQRYQDKWDGYSEERRKTAEEVSKADAIYRRRRLLGLKNEGAEIEGFRSREGEIVREQRLINAINTKEKLEQAQSERKLLEIQQQNLLKEIELNKEIFDIRRRITEENKGYFDLTNQIIEDEQNRLIILTAQERKQREIFESQESILLNQIDAIDKIRREGGILSKEEEKQLTTLEFQVEALRIQENLRIEEVKKTKEAYEFSIKQLKLTEIMNVVINQTSLAYNEIYDNVKLLGSQYEINLGLIDNEIERLKSKEEHNERLRELYKEERLTFEQRKAAQIAELDYFVRIKDLQNEKLENEIEILRIQQHTLEVESDHLETKIRQSELSKELIENEIERTELILKQAKTDEERLAAQQSLANLEQQLRDINKENSDLKSEQLDLAIELEQANVEIEASSDEILKNQQEITDETDKTTANIEEQAKLYSKLQGLVGQYAEEIQLVADIIGQSFELAATLFDRRAAVAQQTLDGLHDELSALEGEVSDLGDERIRLEEELKDANGERYDELVAQIDAIAVQEVSAIEAVETKNQEIDEQEKKRVEAEYKAAKWRKAQGIVDGLIQTTLAVIKALPNIFLSVATGVLGAAGVATIAAQKLPPKPEGYIEGGYTGLGRDNEPAGIVHRNEYVVPAKVAQSPAGKSHIAALERKRVKGYAVGGPVTQAVDTGLDYDKFTSMLAMAVGNLPSPQVSLVSVSNGIRDVELTKQNSGLNR